MIVPTLVFRDDETRTVGWAGDWPPPERMAIAFGTLTGEVTYLDIDMTSQATLDKLAYAEVHLYRLAEFTAVPTGINGNVMRSALYDLDYAYDQEV